MYYFFLIYYQSYLFFYNYNRDIVVLIMKKKMNSNNSIPFWVLVPTQSHLAWWQKMICSKIRPYSYKINWLYKT